MKTELPGVPTSTVKSFLRMLSVPTTPPSSPQIFDVIRIWYTVTVEAVMGFRAFNQSLKMFVPITIGTIPLRESIENCNQPSSSELPNTSLLTRKYKFRK